MRRLLFLWAISAGAGCFHPSYGNGDVQCEAGAHPCPSGYHCADDRFCWRNGSGPSPADGGVTADMAPSVTTFPPAAVWIACGGGAGTAASATQLATSMCELSVAGTAIGSAGSVITFGYFSDDTF